MVSCNSVLKRDFIFIVIKVSRFRPMQIEHFLHKCPLANNLSFGPFRMLTPRDQQETHSTNEVYGKHVVVRVSGENSANSARI